MRFTIKIELECSRRDCSERADARLTLETLGNHFKVSNFTIVGLSIAPEWEFTNGNFGSLCPKHGARAFILEPRKCSTCGGKGPFANGDTMCAWCRGFVPRDVRPTEEVELLRGPSVEVAEKWTKEFTR